MKKLILLISLLSVFSCVNQKEIDAKAAAKSKHQAETGKGLTNLRKNTEGLFDEMK